MKIAIVNITGGGMSGGYRKYLAAILPRIIRDSRIDQILCTMPSTVAMESFPESNSKLQYSMIDPYGIFDVRYDWNITRILDEFRPDVVFVPVERTFSYKDAPVVTMLQNMEPFVHPCEGNPFSEKIKNFLRALSARRALKRGDRIIGISKFVEDYLVSHLGIDPRKIGRVYHGIEEFTGNPTRPAAISAEQKEFLFTAGSIRPARGLEDIIEALGVLSSRGIRVPLIIAGTAQPSMKKYFDGLQKKIARIDLSNQIVWAGDLSGAEMAWCYRNCSVFVMTSRVEACSNIALEAMLHGCVSISADIPSLQELLGNCAVYYSASDSQMLAEQISRAYANEVNDEYRDAARRRVQQFSWDVCAERTIEELSIAVRDFGAVKKGKS